MNLYEKIEILVNREDFEIPKYIMDNLNPSIVLRPYQEDALKYFLFYEQDKQLRDYPSHTLFHMATGSGKTVIMAALMMHLYKLGYRNFLFFVNSTNIVEKTKDNFLNSSSSKYLFADSIIIDGDKVNINEVSSFEESIENSININFTTIQELHLHMTTLQENSVTIEEFKGRKTVLISDEAHHINTLTKSERNLTKGEKDHKSSWEETVQDIFSTDRENMLLEFTATMDMANHNIKEKYSGKIIYDYPLKKFRQDGYSKDIELRQSRASLKDKMFQSVIFSQYRRKLAENNGIHIKPVIMMKSNEISASKKNTDDFISFINNLSGEFIKNSRKESVNDPTLKIIYDYLFDKLKLSYENFSQEIKEDFSNDKIINVNEKKSASFEPLINSLENPNNEIRVVFAVNKLNEGWDVLNLFDIVRLYDQAGTNKTTMQEAQLIGRGARYCPFIDKSKDHDEMAKRKYDDDLKNPLRMLEELYYHCFHNPDYIADIKSALQKTGAMDQQDELSLDLKDSFKETYLYKHGVIYINKQNINSNKNKYSLADYEISQRYEYPEIITEAIVEESAISNQAGILTPTKNIEAISIKFKDISLPVLQRAIDGIKFFHFDVLKKFLPKCKSMQDLFFEMGDFVIEVKGDSDKIKNLTSKQKKNIIHFALEQIEMQVKVNSTEYVGSRKFTPCKISHFDFNKTVKKKDTDVLLKLDDDWYVYKENFVNSLEKEFVNYIREKTSVIKENFGEFYLLRNENLVKIYAFADGKGFEPDFLLFLTDKENAVPNKIIYQIFIEPKGEHIYQKDFWKEDFLSQLYDGKLATMMYDNDRYNIIGLPFYREGDKSGFKDKFEKILGVN